MSKSEYYLVKVKPETRDALACAPKGMVAFLLDAMACDVAGISERFNKFLKREIRKAERNGRQ